MTHDPFDIWRKRGAAAGQRELADSLRTLVFRADESLFDRLDFADDAQFLHPTLFAHLTNPAPTASLAQTLYGIIKPERRPSQITVHTDADGSAFLGPLGTLKAELPFAPLELGRENLTGRYLCTKGTTPVGFRFRAPVIVPGSQIQLTTDIDPLFQPFFVSSDGRPIDLATVRARPTGLSQALLALALLRAYCPRIWAEIATFVQLVVLYTAPAPNSFAALSAHGALFCNLQPGDSELAVLEDLAHQGAHVIFNAFAHDPARLLRADADTPVEALSDAPGDSRPLHAAFHALFTYTLICRVLIAVRESNAVSDVQSHELLGRIGFTLEKFAYDLRVLRLPHAYTRAGRRCYDAFAAEFAALQSRYGGQVANLDLRGQPYVFDYRCFLTRNGGPWPAICELAS